MKERVSILIDGANFYLLALNKLGIRDAQFDYDAFADFLAAGRDLSARGRRFYIGTVREREGDAKSKEAMSRQTALLTRLRFGGWETKTSKHRRRIEEIVVDERMDNYEALRECGIMTIRYERYREKGIDVSLLQTSLSEPWTISTTRRSS
jgi:hypothetical protein